MTDGRSWQGNWKARLYGRVRERGHDSLTAFADARPAVPLHALADELGKDDVAAVQVLSGLLDEAERGKHVTRFVRDVFVRELSDGFPDGWPPVVDEANLFDVAHMLARWTNYTPDSHKERVERVRVVLRESPPPPGWRPLGPDDELLRILLPDEEA
ncbi:NUDIX hydrolase [Myxococcus stipitatus]|uniref:NUDIX hydrolase n=1 Tax=Myxococcus stipitatus TaxID=83455 RepID=UPI0031450D14